MNLAPIVIFAFNRLNPLQNLVESLLGNEEAKDSDLYVFVDGAREGYEGEEEKVKNVRQYVCSIIGFKSVNYRFSEENQGLANSIIAGTTEVINKYGQVIVLEDDLILSENFLSFMNQALNEYEMADEVFSVCGYSNKVKIPERYGYDAYFSTRSSSWGWGTWVNRWNKVDWELKDWKKYTLLSNEFNKWGGSDCWKMLNDWHNGRNQSWAIRFCFNQFQQNGLSLFPITSKVANKGFDGEGTNCRRWSRFKFDWDMSGKKVFSFPESFLIDKNLHRSAMVYHGKLLRIWSRLMYMIH